MHHLPDFGSLFFSHINVDLRLLCYKQHNAHNTSRSAGQVSHNGASGPGAHAPQVPHPPTPPQASPPCCFPPGDLTRQLLDPVEEGVCRPPVQGLWAEQGHAPAGRAPPGPLPEEWKDAGEEGSGAASWTSEVRRTVGSRNEETVLEGRHCSPRGGGGGGQVRARMERKNRGLTGCWVLPSGSRLASS